MTLQVAITIVLIVIAALTVCLVIGLFSDECLVCCNEDAAQRRMLAKMARDEKYEQVL